jgi:hypothetical protein
LGSLGRGFDVVIDATGHLSFAAARPLLRPGGSYVSSDLGHGGSVPPSPLTWASSWSETGRKVGNVVVMMPGLRGEPVLDRKVDALVRQVWQTGAVIEAIGKRRFGAYVATEAFAEPVSSGGSDLVGPVLTEPGVGSLSSTLQASGSTACIQCSRAPPS